MSGASMTLTLVTLFPSPEAPAISFTPVNSGISRIWLTVNGMDSTRLS
jgi:hypothetical protein